MKSHHATISNGCARQVRPQGSHRMGEVSQARILTGPVAVRVRDLLRQIATENDLHIISGKVSSDHVHMFLSYRAHRNISGRGLSKLQHQALKIVVGPSMGGVHVLRLASQSMQPPQRKDGL
jgi:REP element-mobilizing transposase RayT